ncbi:MAG: c-type cytochrome [Candidatus Acidiferrales bacterium]
MRSFLLGIIFTIVIIFVGGYLALKRGYLDFEADKKASLFEKHVAMAAVDASTDRRAPERKNPLTASEETLVAGSKLYLDHCAGCHGTPGNPESQFSQSFYPEVPTFFKDAPDMAENQNYYIIEHGVRWTGMPSWNKTLSSQQIWQLVTFLSNVEKLPPAALKTFEPPAAAPAEVPAAKR